MTSWSEIMHDEAERVAAAETPVADLAAMKGEVERLAKLDDGAFELERKAVAKALGVRAAALEAMVKKARGPQSVESTAEALEVLEPWETAVDGAALAEDVRRRLLAHVVFTNPSDADVTTLWIIGTYLMSTWHLFARLMINSATKACGKTTLLVTLDAMVCKGLAVSNMKSAGVFRAIDAWQPCLLLDEADTWMKADEELAGIINSGHTRRLARVIRVVEKNGEHVPVMFSTWCAMAIAGIGSQRDTIMSRSVIVGLRRKLPSERIERLPFDLHERLAPLRRQLARWTADNALELGGMKAEPPECGNDRRRDNFTPLHRIALALGGPWPGRLASAYVVQAANEDEDDEPAGVMLLKDMIEVFTTRRADRLQSADLVIDLCNLEERPWAEWRHGRPLTPQSIAKLLRPFDVRPRNAKLAGQVLKSYHRADVYAAYVRYAPPPPEKPLPRYQIEDEGEKGSVSVAGSGYEEKW